MTNPQATVEIEAATFRPDPEMFVSMDKTGCYFVSWNEADHKALMAKFGTGHEARYVRTTSPTPAAEGIVDRLLATVAEEEDEYAADAAEAIERGERPDLWEREVTIPVAWVSEAASLIASLTAEREALGRERTILIETKRGQLATLTTRAETAEAALSTAREALEQIATGRDKDGLKVDFPAIIAGQALDALKGVPTL